MLLFFQDLHKPIPTNKLYPNWKLHPFLKHILSVFRFSWLLDFSLAVDDQNIGFQCHTLALTVRSYKYFINLRAKCGFCDPDREQLLV